MKIIAGIVATFALLAPQAAAKPGHAEPLMALLSRGSGTALVRLDGHSLDRQGPAVSLGYGPATFLSRSPGGGRVAVASGESALLKIVDLARGRVVRSAFLGGTVLGGLWTQPDRLVLLAGGDAGGVYVVTLGRRTSMRWHSLDAAVVSWTRTPTGLVALLGPTGKLGPARLAVVGEYGDVRVVDLPGVTAGWSSPDGPPYVIRMAVPGLAVDPAGTRAAVVTRFGPPLVVDLQTLAVRGRSLAAARKEVSGYIRSAVWFAPGLIAVSGMDASGQEQWTPAGLTLIDTRDWSARLVDPDVRQTLLGGPALLAYGRGMSGYDADGSRLFTALGAEAMTDVVTVGRYAYASADGHQFTILDASTGEVAGNAYIAAAASIVGAW